MGKANIRIDVFISCKNLDEHGVQTRDLPRKFNIDSALESATVLLAIDTVVLTCHQSFFFWRLISFVEMVSPKGWSMGCFSSI